MSNGSNRRELDDLQAFPILTSEAGQAEVIRTSAGGAPTPSVGRIAESALRDILAIRPTTADAESIVAALNNAFSSTEVDGRVAWKWTPRSFTVQADMGEVTGAQASIYTRAKTMLDQSVQLLDTLNALSVAADDEDVDATRSTVRTYLLELINELGTPGGPRVQRVDTIFEALLGSARDLLTDQPIVDPEKIGGLLGTIRDRMGLTRPNVNTIAEEQTLTDFLVLAEHVIALRLSWEAQRPYFSGGGDVFLGTQLVLLGRALGVVAESVHEAEFTLDSVFIGPDERQTTPLVFPADSGETPLKIGELFGWIGHFASEEGPRIIREAGKDGVIALVPTLDRLTKLAELTQEIAESDSNNPTPGFHTPRVRRALSELVDHLEEAQKLARQVRRTPGPEIIEIEPTSAAKDQSAQITVFGSFFQRGASVRLEPGASYSGTPITATNTRFVSDTLLIASFDLRAAASGSVWSIVVVNPDFGEFALPNALQIAGTAGPEVAEVEPTSAPNTQPLQLTVFGSFFQLDASVRLTPGTANAAEPALIARARGQNGRQSNTARPSARAVNAAPQSDTAVIPATRTRFVSPNLLLATFDLSAALPDSVWSVVVTNPDGVEGELVDAFTVAGVDEPEVPEPAVDEVEPTSAPRDQPLRLEVFGEDFQPEAEVRLEPGTGNSAQPILATRTRFVGEGMLIANFDVSAAPANSVWNVIVANSDIAEGELVDAFTATGDSGPAPSSSPPPSSSPTPREEPQESLRAQSVELASVSENRRRRVGRFDLPQPQDPPIVFRAEQSISVIRVTFSRALHRALVNAGDISTERGWPGFSLRERSADQVVPGVIHVDPHNPRVLEFVVADEQSLGAGRYVAQLTSHDDPNQDLPPLTDRDQVGFDEDHVEIDFAIDAD